MLIGEDETRIKVLISGHERMISQIVNYDKSVPRKLILTKFSKNWDYVQSVNKSEIETDTEVNI